MLRFFSSLWHFVLVQPDLLRRPLSIFVRGRLEEFKQHGMITMVKECTCRMLQSRQCECRLAVASLPQIASLPQAVSSKRRTNRASGQENFHGVKDCRQNFSFEMYTFSHETALYLP